MSELYPTAQQLGLKPSKPTPAPARPARPAKPMRPPKGPQQKTQMRTPWDRAITVSRDAEPEKLRQGYKLVKRFTKPPQDLNKRRPAVKPAKGAKATKKVDYNQVFEMKSFQEIIKSIEKASD